MSRNLFCGAAFRDITFNIRVVADFGKNVKSDQFLIEFPIK